jgi:hypothetical protein
VFEFPESVREQVRADVGQSMPQFGEALRRQEQLADDQQSPSLTDDVEGPGDPT